MKNPSHVQSVVRAITLLELLAEEKREMSLTEISKKTGWPKSTAHGLLGTLRDFHYIDQSPENGRYRLGVRLFELGNIVARSWNIRDIAKPVMEQLSNVFGETVQLAAEDGGEVLYLEKIDSSHLMRIVSEIGTRLPMHCSGLGKVLLAYKTPAEVKWIVSQKGMRAMTLRTITTLPALEKELGQIRKQGYAVDDREIMDSLRCVAAPIRNEYGEVKYALSISGFIGNMQGEYLERIIAAVLDGANSISYSMGYRSDKKLVR